jgi:hypothetical protein
MHLHATAPRSGRSRTRYSTLWLVRGRCHGNGPVPELPETKGPKEAVALAAGLGTAEGLSIRELYLRIAGARTLADVRHARTKPRLWLSRQRRAISSRLARLKLKTPVARTRCSHRQVTKAEVGHLPALHRALQ